MPEGEKPSSTLASPSIGEHGKSMLKDFGRAGFFLPIQGRNCYSSRRFQPRRLDLRDRNRMRSLLMVSTGDDLEAGLACGTDTLIIGIDPGGKDESRQHARANLERARTHHASLFVAVHPLVSGAVDADLDAIMPARPDGILLPTTLCGSDLQHLSVKLAVREAECGFEEGTTKILAVAGATSASLLELKSLRARPHGSAASSSASMIWRKKWGSR